ncbi:NAD(P)-dependent oxidoreductase [Photobacterium sanguinicancri]|uniref:SDR family oxidoreductase n=1 Tax=Photobacterium sanguinicancri TaxID=875932 RepID=A0AAW7Y065_9GAMM|nr:NAD(P)-binding oxidoreductase [Photobacterium sanguinicancri]MDO6541737.1 SDR family oxidoreductase [Photobacterium sanguinicancri]
MTQQKLLILGASGGCGQWAVELAVAQGYLVTVLIRQNSQYTPPAGVKVIYGNILDPQTVKDAMSNQNAVISCLGIKRKTAKNPWSALASPSDLATQSTKNIVDAMTFHDIKRLVVVSAAGVAESFSNISTIMKLLIKGSNINKTSNDFAAMEKILANSAIDSLAVRPVGLVDQQTDKKAVIVDHFDLSSQISKKDVAQWMLDAIARPDPFDSPTEMIGWQ